MTQPTLSTVLAVALAAGLLAAPAEGQRAPGTAPDSSRSGLTYVLGIGYEQGGPGSEVARSFVEAGYGDNRTPRAGVRQEYPFDYTDGLNLAAFVGARYRFDAPYSIELIFSNGHRGHAEGFDGGDLSELTVSWASFLITATLGVHLGPVRLAAGPTLNAMYWSATLNEQDLGGPNTTVLGATALAAAEIPTQDVLVSITVGTRSFPTVDLVEAAFIPVTAYYRTFFVGVTVLPLL